jgi:signal transduction histidine kinase/sensor domain CHASE-containing protein/ActR/RegA family two-component response regulator
LDDTSTSHAPPSARTARHALVPYAILATSLLLTLLAWQYVRTATDAREQLRFQNEVQHARKSIQDRLDVYITLLQGAAGLFAADPEVDAAGFRDYVTRAMEDPRYDGVQGIGYTARVQPGDRAAFEARMRREGQDGFRIWSATPSPELHTIAYLEPMDARNRQAIGYNMFSEPTRRAAMVMARDTGLASASGVVRLVQEFRGDPHPQNGFLIYVPVYRGGALPREAMIGERRRLLLGFTYSPFRMADLVRGVFPTRAPDPHIRFDIYDSATQTPEHLLYRSDPGPAMPARFKATTPIDAGGREWSVVFATQPAFDIGAGRAVVPLTLVGGVMISLLLFGITMFQARSRQAAERAAATLRTSIQARELAEQAVRAGEDRLRRLYDEAREARADAEEANRLKDEFLATVSHELRTPLNAIMGYSQLLRMENRSPEQHHRSMEAIERNVKAQAQLIDDLLDISRIISGKLRLEMQSVDPADVVRHAVEAVAHAAETKSIALVTDLDADVGCVRGDPGRLQQIVWNLLSNAIKFTPAGGRVEVTLKGAHRQVILTVWDTGRGIRPELLSHIFDRFRQADSSTTRQFGGLGLGLSIVRQLVELHGGTVVAESDGENTGARFIVSLPVAAVVEPEAVAGRASDVGAAARLDGVRVLTVDDDADARALVRDILEDAGAVVATAASSAGAMAEIERAVPDVLVSDIGMPDEDGYGLIRRVRALDRERGGEVPAVALTAFARVEDRRKVLDAGFQMYAAKPVEPRELIAVVARLAGN